MVQAKLENFPQIVKSNLIEPFHFHLLFIDKQIGNMVYVLRDTNLIFYLVSNAAGYISLKAAPDNNMPIIDQYNKVAIDLVPEIAGGNFTGSIQKIAKVLNALVNF